MIIWDAMHSTMIHQVQLDFLGYMSLLVLFFILFGAYFDEFGPFHVHFIIVWVQLLFLLM